MDKYFSNPGLLAALKEAEEDIAEIARRVSELAGLRGGSISATEKVTWRL